MKRIREKLRSESGASILLALMFFLLCAMVGASVLMAAASNAGKSRSSREEQQKYLTLSSAMQLVCDELTAAKYEAKFTVETKTVYITNGKGEVTGSYSYREISQGKGAFSSELSTVLPVESAMEYLFSRLFLQTGNGASSGDDIYRPLSGVSAPSETKYTLTLTVKDQADKPGLKKPVTVTVEFRLNDADQYKFHLSASLDGYTMYAELTANDVPNRSSLNKGDGSYTHTVTWTLKQIARGKIT